MRVAILVPVACLALCGCLWDDLERDKPKIHNQKIDTPQMTEASIESAARVDQVGRLLVGQNPFLGIEPVFQTFGLSEPEIWHPDFHGVFISEGLVKQCATDEELAAVLASELAKMVEEQKVAAGFRKAEPMQLPPESNIPGTIASHNHDLGIQAMADQKLGQPKRGAAPLEKAVEQKTEEILKSAGYETKLIAQVRPLLEQSKKNRALAKQFGDRGDKPTWSR
jgi:hypothetical protein